MKPWWASKTIWLNSITAAVAALEAGYGALREAYGPEAYLWVSIVVAVVTVWLRVYSTSKPIDRE